MARRQLLGGALALVALLAAAPRPTAALQALTHPSGAAPTEPLLAAVALTAWALATWLAAAALLTRLGALSGLLGQTSLVLLRRIAPPAVRRALAVAVGVSVVLGTAGAGTAGASGAGPAIPAQVQLDWPYDGGASSSLDWPAGRAPAAAPPSPARPTPAQTPPQRVAASTAPDPTGPPRPGPSATSTARTGAHTTAAGAAPRHEHGQTVVVRPGDSLWRLARERLPADAGPARVAAAWPAWWSANRDVLGDDPDLLHVGMRLEVPDPPR